MKTRSAIVLAPFVAALGIVAAPASAGAADTNSASMSWAPDAVFLQAGRASETSTLTLGLQWDWRRQWQLGDRARVSGYNELSLGHWRADEGGGSAIVTQIGFTPTLRYWPTGETKGWFGEAGIGFNALTPIYRTREKRFSTAFNFGDHLAVGYRAASARRWEWSLRLQHFSNAGIHEPNPGENFVQVRLVMPLRQQGS
ncbi:MAG TPA: acyloxyacyl hydrolase [Burkholderiaceae bacterium]|nr:acyloxyacyl hydrolase [Burkholderiaceae bacterium]